MNDLRSLRQLPGDRREPGVNRKTPRVPEGGQLKRLLFAPFGDAFFFPLNPRFPTVTWGFHEKVLSRPTWWSPLENYQRPSIPCIWLPFALLVGLFQSPVHGGLRFGGRCSLFGEFGRVRYQAQVRSRPQGMSRTERVLAIVFGWRF